MRLISLLLVFLSTFLSAEEITLRSNHLDEPLMQSLIRLFKVEVLVETGTWVGQTAERAAPFFRDIYTVELSPQQYEICQMNLKPLVNVHLYQGDSPAFLKEVIPAIQGRILFWLDAHWCGGNSAQSGLATPIRGELQAIRETGLQNGIILIDDIRHFHDLPSDIPEYSDYPSLNKVKQMVLEINPTYQFWVLGDVAIAYPAGESVAVSSLVKACTTSRLYERGSADEVLAAEEVIRQQARSSEAKEFHALQGLATVANHPFIVYHLLLWEGLSKLGERKYSAASAYFRQILSSGYDHWRIKWYLAEAEVAAGKRREAANHLKQVLKEVPDFGPAKNLLLKMR